MLATDRVKIEIGHNLRRVLDREGVSLYRAAQILGMDKTAPGKAIKNGPSLKMLIAVASQPEFNTTLEELVGVKRLRAGEAPIDGRINSRGGIESAALRARHLNMPPPEPRGWLKAPDGAEAPFALTVDAPAALADFPDVCLEDGDALLFSTGIRWLTHGRIVIVTRMSPGKWSARAGVYFNAYRREGVIPLYDEDAEPFDLNDGWAIDSVAVRLIRDL